MLMNKNLQKADMVSEIVEIQCLCRNAEHRVGIFAPNLENMSTAFEGYTMGSIHVVLKVQLVTGYCFAVDLSGAQFGYHKPAMPWEEYERLRIQRAIERTKATGMKLFQNWGYKNLDERHELLRGRNQNKDVEASVGTHIIRPIHLYMIEWLGAEKMTLGEMWTMPDDVFVKKAKDLMNYAELRYHQLEFEWSTENGRRLMEEIRGSAHGGE